MNRIEPLTEPLADSQAAWNDNGIHYTLESQPRSSRYREESVPWKDLQHRFSVTQSVQLNSAKESERRESESEDLCRVFMSTTYPDEVGTRSGTNETNGLIIATLPKNKCITRSLTEPNCEKRQFFRQCSVTPVSTQYFNSCESTPVKNNISHKNGPPIKSLPPKPCTDINLETSSTNNFEQQSTVRATIKPSLKASTTRRSRHSSGHSVTFDLPEDCDNLCLPRNRSLELLDTVTKDEKEKCNEAVKTKDNAKAHGLTLPLIPSYSADIAKQTIPHALIETEWRNAARSYPNSREPSPPLNQGVDSRSVCSSPANSVDEPSCRRKQYGFHLSSSIIKDSSLPNQSSSLTSSHTATSSLPNTWSDETSGTDLPPPHNNLEGSRDWPSRSSTMVSSNAPENDSGYWGAINSEKEKEVKLEEVKKVEVRRKRSYAIPKARDRGVKVVTDGKEFFLSYAYLHQGRLRLNIVPGKFYLFFSIEGILSNLLV